MSKTTVRVTSATQIAPLPSVLTIHGKGFFKKQYFRSIEMPDMFTLTVERINLFQAVLINISTWAKGLFRV